jgi:ABC-type glutathione transport system ATPase component
VEEPASIGHALAGQGPILEVRDLYVHFGARRGRGPTARAVDGVDLQVQPGEIVALAGESGCGKTTLARAILGLVEPTSGQVLYRGSPIGRGTAALKPYRREVQLVLQDPTGALNPRQSVYESVAEGLRIHGVKGDEETLVADALARSGLRPPRRFFLAYPHELSGGQRQRVVIAGALALEPSMLVADEPVSSLDASVRGEILALLLGLVRDLGLSVLVVTHDLGLAWNIADRLAVMYLGRIVEQGPTEAVLPTPATPTPGPAVGRPRGPPPGDPDPLRRAARPDPGPRRLPLPPPLPGPGLRRGRPGGRERPLPQRAHAHPAGRGRASCRLLPD